MDPQYDNDQVVIKNNEIVDYLGLQYQTTQNYSTSLEEQNEQPLAKVA